jgi:hypothetical protein
MQTQHAHKIKELITECRENCKCKTQDIKNLCKARDIGLDTFVECLEKNSFECSDAIPYGHTTFCSCPLRVYIAKKLGR